MSYIKNNKEFIVYPINGGSNTDGNWAVEESISGGTQNYKFCVPMDFKTLTTASISIIPDATETIQWDMDVSVAAIGEDKANDTRQALNQTLSTTVDVLNEIDISGQLTGLSPTDWVGVKLSSDTSDIRCLALRIKYE